MQVVERDPDCRGDIIGLLASHSPVHETEGDWDGRSQSLLEELRVHQTSHQKFWIEGGRSVSLHDHCIGIGRTSCHASNGDIKAYGIHIPYDQWLFFKPRPKSRDADTLIGDKRALRLVLASDLDNSTDYKPIVVALSAEGGAEYIACAPHEEEDSLMIYEFFVALGSTFADVAWQYDVERLYVLALREVDGSQPAHIYWHNRRSNELRHAVSGALRPVPRWLMAASCGECRWHDG
ncbi:hypothetical protein JAAARDRAFT_551386 [Jaapia argillacea MUCL 33604]|uniref:Uncharacterized protein n=1 Tax=Jaapia argillacea MUCL 33604 TaxID=933084 RepID=A0A067PIA5_9AGAM|nr:hypothetical protein JAAARDRAFT_551386 [Jaapia argillacea MUCL 33604]